MWFLRVCHQVPQELYDLPVPIVMKSGSLNCLECPRPPLARTTIALPLRFTLCRLQVQEPSKMYLARSRCRHNSNSTIDGYKWCSESGDTFYRLQYLKKSVPTPFLLGLHYRVKKNSNNPS